MKKGVVLVHGYLDSDSTFWWNRIQGFMKDLGFYVDTVNLGSIGTTIDSPVKYSHQIRQCVERFHSECEECSEIVIIGHSMGGIAARWYIEEMDGNERVDSLITLGTPHRGTFAAYLGIFSDGGKQLTPSSKVIKRLNSKGPAENVEYHIISGKKDNMIIPSENGTLPSYGEKNNVNNYKLNCGHIKMVMSLSKFRKSLSLAGLI